MQDTDHGIEISAAEWSWVHDLIRDSEVDRCQTLFARIVRWYLASLKFREVEYKMFTDGLENNEILSHQFESCLTLLISTGNDLLSESTEFTLDMIKMVGFTRDQLKACIDDLRITYREFNHGMSADEITQIRNKIFS
jgi:hypothetical protein